jgi:hypothetical protein
MNAGNTSRFESASLAFICGQNLPVWPPKLRFPLSCSLLAFAYAIRIHWSDGHNSGTSIFNHFARSAPAPGCRGNIGSAGSLLEALQVSPPQRHTAGATLDSRDSQLIIVGPRYLPRAPLRRCRGAASPGRTTVSVLLRGV